MSEAYADTPPLGAEIYKVQRPIFSTDEAPDAEAVLIYNKSRSHIGQVTMDQRTIYGLFRTGEFKIYVYATPKQVGYQDKGINLEIFDRAPAQEW